MRVVSALHPATLKVTEGTVFTVAAAAAGTAAAERQQQVKPNRWRGRRQKKRQSTV
jgi:hypothetical protein